MYFTRNVVKKLSFYPMAVVSRNKVDKNKWTLAKSSTDSVYTISILDNNIDYSPYTPQASQLFRRESKYVSPQELHFELPKDGVPEYAFVGRSNVGKSSLINCLFGNNKIVRVSKEPGCTKNINYFAFTKKSGAAVTYFVDLPGYGYARKSREDRAKWNGLIKDFLMVRDISVLRRVYILIDGRRGPSEMDGEMMETLTKAALTHQVIITKADLLTDLDLRKTLEATMTEIMKPKRHACLPIVHVLSAKTNYGILPLMQSIAEINSDKWDNNSQPGQSENPPASQVGNQ